MELIELNENELNAVVGMGGEGDQKEDLKTKLEKLNAIIQVYEDMLKVTRKNIARSAYGSIARNNAVKDLEYYVVCLNSFYEEYNTLKLSAK